jgi:5-bromo-4-chloroindolyl phosphate hydrolysis protein
MAGSPRSRSAILSCSLGGVVFALLLILFGRVGWAAFGGAASLIAGLLIFAPAKTRKPHRIEMHGVTQSDLEEALALGTAKVEELKEATAQIRSKEVRSKAEDVADLAHRIIEDVEKDPRDLKRARQFLNYYMDTTIKIVRRYVSLSEQGVRSAEIRASMRKVEEVLDTLKSAFARQLAILFEDDVMDLDAELEVLERTIKLEGLADDEG